MPASPAGGIPSGPFASSRPDNARRSRDQLCLTQLVVSDRMAAVEIRFTQAARRHRIGKASVRFVLAHVSTTGVTTSQGSPAWRWVGVDERDRELEIVAVEVQGDQDPEPVLLVLHVMPTHYRKEPS